MGGADGGNPNDDQGDPSDMLSKSRDPKADVTGPFVLAFLPLCYTLRPLLLLLPAQATDLGQRQPEE